MKWFDIWTSTRGTTGDGQAMLCQSPIPFTVVLLDDLVVGEVLVTPQPLTFVAFGAEPRTILVILFLVFGVAKLVHDCSAQVALDRHRFDHLLNFLASSISLES